MDHDAYDTWLHHIFRQTQGGEPSAENIHAGVCLRIQTGQYRVFPYEKRSLEPFEAAVRVLNPIVAVKVHSAAVDAALSTVDENATAIYIDDDTRIQILERMPDLQHADKEQCGAFIRDERVLVVWSDSLDSIIPLCRDFNDHLIRLVWSGRQSLTRLIPGSSLAPTPVATSATNSASDVDIDP